MPTPPSPLQQQRQSVSAVPVEGPADDVTHAGDDDYYDVGHNVFGGLNRDANIDDDDVVNGDSRRRYHGYDNDDNSVRTDDVDHRRRSYDDEDDDHTHFSDYDPFDD